MFPAYSKFILGRIHAIIRTQRIGTMSGIHNWCNDFFYVAFPDTPLYLKSVSSVNGQTESKTRNSGNVSKCLDDEGKIYIVMSRNLNDGDTHRNYLRSAIDAHDIYRLSSAFTYAEFSHCDGFTADVLSSFNTGGHIKRGVCITCSTGDSVKQQQLVKKVQEHLPEKLQSFELQQEENGIFLLSDLTQSVERAEAVKYRIVERDSVPGLARCGTLESPVLAIPEVSPVFHSYQEARTVLEKLSERPEVQELLDITNKYVTMETKQSHDQVLPYPFVVVEGMDATGKTTQTEVLEKRLGAARYCTPPPQIGHLRPAFDRLPEVVRRAYYSMGNYIVAGEIILECQNRPVIMDRFWHSTAAYGIANETSYADLPTASSPVYQWPGDLLRPSLVLFLTVSEEIRKQRLAGRGVQVTFEEGALDRDQLFRTRLCESYRRMRDPGCVEVDAGGTVTEVTRKVQDVLQENGVQLDTNGHVGGLK